MKSDEYMVDMEEEMDDFISHITDDELKPIKRMFLTIKAMKIIPSIAFAVMIVVILITKSENLLFLDIFLMVFAFNMAIFMYPSFIESKFPNIYVFESLSEWLTRYGFAYNEFICGQCKNYYIFTSGAKHKLSHTITIIGFFYLIFVIALILRIALL